MQVTVTELLAVINPTKTRGGVYCTGSPDGRTAQFALSLDKIIDQPLR